MLHRKDDPIYAEEQRQNAGAGMPAGNAPLGPGQQPMAGGPVNNAGTAAGTAGPNKLTRNTNNNYDAGVGTVGGAGTPGQAEQVAIMPGPAPNTSGPHRRDILNKLDPRVDSKVVITGTAVNLGGGPAAARDGGSMVNTGAGVGAGVGAGTTTAGGTYGDRYSDTYGDARAEHLGGPPPHHHHHHHGHGHVAHGGAAQPPVGAGVGGPGGANVGAGGAPGAGAPVSGRGPGFTGTNTGGYQPGVADDGVYDATAQPPGGLRHI